MSQIKPIALYLPQFHQIPENDNWWGAGYTEWTAVQKAEPIFKNHNQPRIPLHNNYYNLLERETMEWQVHLAKKFEIYGFCFYHYWFKDGKQLLEKPAENLLLWKDVDMPYFFSWANTTWARTWSKISDSFDWAEIYEGESKSHNKKSGVLLEQKYGNSEDWEKHFQYLLPFFKDNRYVKIDEKPVFMICRPDLIPCFDAMFHLWNKLAKESGLPGIYIIGGDYIENQNGSMNAVVQTKPEMNIFNDIGGSTGYFKYSDLQEMALKKEYYGKTYLCAMVDYDDTPRRGNRGTVCIGSNPFEFYNYFDVLVKKSLQLGNEYIFINAWNEWGEGMYLEPDTNNGYGYLYAVKKVVDKYKLEESITLDKPKTRPLKTNAKESLEKSQEYFSLLNKWFILKQCNISLEHYFKKNNYVSVAIYGMGELGIRLQEELGEGNIKVKYAIDKRAELIYSEIPVYGLNHKLPNVDVIVITATYYYTQISKELSLLVNCPIVSLQEVVQES